MKTTLNLPDELYRELKVRAAREGVPVTDLVVKGLQMLMAAGTPKARRIEFPLIPAKKSSKRLTTADVRKAMAQMDAEEDLAIAATGRR